MAISFAYDNPIECPECETAFANSSWVVIDKREEPDGWDRCRKDTIHCSRCPAGHAFRVQAPLLLHDPSSNRLLYSPAPVASPSQASTDLQSLLRLVSPSLPTRTLNELESRLIVVAREFLPLAMANLQPEIIAVVEEIYRALSAPFTGNDAAQWIGLAEYALSQFQKSEAPMLWATFKGRMANYIRLNSGGNPAENIEQALQLSELVLASLREHDEPIRLAIAQMNLGVLYGDRMMGDVAENRHLAIQLLEESLQVFLPRLFPQYCLLACLNLGIQFLKNGASSRSEDTECAIAAFEKGADAMTPRFDPKSWGDLHQNLGIAYFRRVKGDAGTNLERSIAAYDQALKVRTLEASPHDWVLTQMDRGNSFLIRVKGDRAENIERAIEIYSKAASVANQNGYEIDWARLQYDISYAYQLRVRDTSRANIEESIKAGQRALTVLTRKQFPDDWGNVQQNLGNAYRELGRAGKPDYFERAIEAYSAALSVRSPERSPVDWLMTVDNLVGTYSEHVKGNVKNSERQFHLLEQAAKFDLRNIAPRTYARFLINLGTAYRDRKSGDPQQNRVKALEAFRTAIDLAKEQECYEELRRAVLRLALLQSQSGEWEQVYTEISSAVAFCERNYAAAVTEVGKESEAESNWFLYQMLTDACLRTSRGLEAFLYAEEGAARVLRDELAGLPIPWPGGPPELLDEERRLLEQVRQLDLAIRETDSVELRAQLIQKSEQARVLLEQTWTEIGKHPDGAEYIGLRRSEQLSWGQIQAWLKKQLEPTALVKFVELRDRMVAFVLRAGDDKPLVQELPLFPAKLPTLVETYIKGLHDGKPQHLKQAKEAGRQLGAGLLSPLLPHLSGVRVVCLIPEGLLHYIPLHALEYGGHTLLDTMAVSYAASAAVAIKGGQPMVDQPATWKIFVAGNPTGDLPFAEVEASAIARRFGTVPVMGKDVSKERLLTEMGQAQTAHLATHAYFDAVDPFASGILLAGGWALSAREAMNEVLHLDLLVLSACSTGVQEIRLSNSLMGLARGFMYAGVKCLVLSLWPVNDLSTMLLMNEFYSGLHRGLQVGESLRLAQLWLRNARADEIAGWFAQEIRREDHERVMPIKQAKEVWRRFVSLDPKARPFQDPHYWAPFFITGRMATQSSQIAAPSPG